MISGSA